MNRYYVYILASQMYGTLYIGVTNNLVRRVYDHKNGNIDGFTKKFKIHSLVYFEETSDIESAIVAEKRMKKWRRQWKIDLIQASNPQWKDLYFDLIGELDPRFRGDDKHFLNPIH